MKKLNLLAMAGVLGFALTSCGSKIEYGKAYLSGKETIAGLPCTIEIKLLENNKCLADLTVNSDKTEMGGMDLNKVFDREGKYEYKDNNYKFSIDNSKKDGDEVIEIWNDFTTKYDPNSENTHTLNYIVYSEFGEVPVTLVGSLPLL